MTTMTAAQRRDVDRVAWDALLARCPSRSLLDLLADKWVPLVLGALGNGGGLDPGAGCVVEPVPLRHAELARVLAGASQKMLTQTLRSLERDGLLTRSVEPAVPVSVTYALTDLGVSLYRLLVDVKGWAELNMPDVEAARAAYDGG